MTESLSELFPVRDGSLIQKNKKDSGADAFVSLRAYEKI